MEVLTVAFPLAMSHFSRLANLKNNNNKFKKKKNRAKEMKKKRKGPASPGHQVPEKQQIGLSFLKVA